MLMVLGTSRFTQPNAVGWAAGATPFSSIFQAPASFHSLERNRIGCKKNAGLVFGFDPEQTGL